MALHRSSELMWTVQKCSRESVNKIFTKIWPGDLLLDPTVPIIKTNILV